MNYLSLDLSKKSPGITLYKDNIYQIYYFNHRKTKKKFYYKKNNYIIEGIDFSNYVNLTRFEIYKFILNNIKEIIKNTENIIVGVEQYAFNVQKSKSITDLAELKGIVIHELKKNENIKEIKEIQIGQWKKYFTGAGNSSKHIIYESFKNETKLDLLEILDLKLCKNGKLPKPIDDISDSIGILYFILNKKVKNKNPIENLIDEII